MQLEFDFVKDFPHVKTNDEWFMDMFNCLRKITPPNMGEIMRGLFDHVNLDNYDGPSIPMTIIVGERNQYEFPFSLPLERAFWGEFDVRLSVDDL